MCLTLSATDTINDAYYGRTEITILTNTTTVVMTTYIIRNNTPETRYSILSSLDIGGAKYGIYPRKKQDTTNITIHKINYMVESNTILGVTGDTVVIQLRRNQMYSDCGRPQIPLSK